MIPETVRRGFKAAWTPPYGPAYISWHSDFNDERVRTEIIAQELIDPRMRVRPNPDELQRAAKLLVEARMPLMVVGDEIYKTKATAKAVKLAEMLGMPVTQVRQLYANFPETHPLWVGNLAGDSLNSLNYPKSADVIINVGNKFQHNGPAPIVPRGPKFIDMRIDHGSMGNVMLTEVPLVCDVGYGLDDLIAAVEQLLTPALRQKAVERTGDVRKFSEWAKAARAQVVNNPDWDQSPIIADRLTWEIAKFADPDAIIVHEAGSVALHSFDFNPIGGRELFFYYGAHLGSGVGTAAGVKLARPNQQVICLVGDGSFIFGPTALWNMARLELPVITVVYNNHAYGGPHSRRDRQRAGWAHGADRPVRARLSGPARHEHGGDRQGLRRRRRGGRKPGAVARSAGARPQAYGRRQALPDRRTGGAQGRGLGRQAVGPADPGGGAAAEEGLACGLRRAPSLGIMRGAGCSRRSPFGLPCASARARMMPISDAKSMAISA